MAATLRLVGVGEHDFWFDETLEIARDRLPWPRILLHARWCCRQDSRHLASRGSSCAPAHVWGAERKVLLTGLQAPGSGFRLVEVHAERGAYAAAFTRTGPT